MIISWFTPEKFYEAGLPDLAHFKKRPALEIYRRIFKKFLFLFSLHPCDRSQTTSVFEQKISPGGGNSGIFLLKFHRISVFSTKNGDFGGGNWTFSNSDLGLFEILSACKIKD